jgi:hypothetical protein
LEGKEEEEEDTAENETNRLRRFPVTKTGPRRFPVTEDRPRRFPVTDDRLLGTWGGSRRDRERREKIKRRRCVS